MPPELKIQQLRYILAVVEQGGFNAAARHLHRSQPALSIAIKELEQRLGAALFEKRGKLSLTPYGAYCLPRFRELVTQHDRVSHELVARADKRAGHVDLACVPSVASRLMPALLSEFIHAYPGLKVSLHDGNAEYVRQQVVSAGVELGISSLWSQEDEPMDDAIAFTPLMRDALGLVCRDDHSLAERQTLNWEELINQTLIGNGTSRLLADTEAAPLLGQNAYFIANMISLTAMLEAGLGVTILPRLAFPEGHPRLRFVPFARPRVERELGLLKSARRSLSPAAEAMADFIEENIDRGGASQPPH